MKIFFCFLLVFACFTPQVSSGSSDPYEYFDNNGVKIAYRVFGSGEPLIVLNGGPGRSSDTFTDLAQTLSSKNYRVILFDQRGTGRSKLAIANENTVTLNLMVSDLEALRKHLHYEKVSILGHSFGGMYAMSYAAQYPENIKSLILSASGGIDLSWSKYANHNMLARLSQKSRNKYKFWTSEEQMKKDSIKATLEALRLLIPAYVYNQKFVPQVEKNLVNLNYYTPEINKLVWKSMENYNLKGTLKNLSAKTLIIAGHQDILGEAVPLTIRHEIPNSRLEFLDECSHYPWLDRPNKYFSLISEFLNK
jgi:proline iminopeptidase